jgi:hypothetical protein
VHADDIDSFFHVRSWLAVQTDDHEEVARLLGAAERRPCALDEYAQAVSGPRTGRDEGFFVCESVDGWTLVFGEDIGLGVPAEIKARKFGQTHAFHLDDKRGNYFCERAIDGTTVRTIASTEGGFSAEGTPDAGEPVLPATESEDTEPGEALQDRPAMSQERVLRIAEAWGADPTQLLGRVQTGLWCRSAVAVRSAAVARSDTRRAAIVLVPLIVAIVALVVVLAIR